MNVCKDITELNPKAQEACNLFLQECSRKGLKVRITETYRSQERQNELYAQGRTAKGNIVTWTKKSRHTSRMAWDICQNVKGQEYSDNNFFKNCGKIAEDLGIIWGGNWKTPDRPHFEINESWSYEGEETMTITERQEFENLQNEIAELKKNAEKVYHFTEELPDYARDTIQKLLNEGIFSGKSESDLGLTETLMRMLVINDRAGLYDRG